MTRSMDRLTKRMNSTTQQRNEAGFTLIELLIVIVILGILAGIAIFAVGGFKASADKACSDANVRINSTVSAANATNSGTTSSATGTCPVP